ncbi:hypothetical protein CVS47_01437 [Microbacterium lemovicicum]|uniref:DUF3093 domain-containing protein n=1 Tax=Microbacterium lemovicicum TaxID=1072463 RepID=A0A3S9W9Y4_9MICO|nr:DUF3093 domain-containing protein [Microbacterium lemovicicum]AZS36824.1 hypothetical protein CVS47_01437 [Microbacterium lemovicicum]
MAMQNVPTRTAAPYRERLGPSMWFLVSAALCGPMAALVFVPLDTTVALVVGALVGVAVVALLVSGSPVITVRDGELRAGRAHIPVEFLDAGSWVSGDDAQYARSAGLHPRAWHLIRGGIDAVAMFAVTDPDDPTPYWVISSRTPDRLVAAVRRAQS